MPNTTHVVSIGRNVGDRPMPPDDWRSFRIQVGLLARNVGEIVFAGDGFGYDTATDRVERSYTVVFTAEEPFDWVERFARGLAYLAAAFCQKTIAWTSGDTSFVPANPAVKRAGVAA